MTRIEHDVRLDRPAAEVFAFLAHGENNPRWQPLVTETAPTSEPLGVGTRFHQRMRHPLGFTVSADYRIVGYAPARELVLQTDSGGPIRPTQRYTLSAGPDGSTTLRVTITCRPRGAMRIALPVLALLHPLFAWEASWIENLSEVLDSPVAAVGV
jgi:uncharacterized protein YndB with AHSA1/START domain